MRHFAFNILPWILIGLSAAVFAASYIVREKNESGDRKKPADGGLIGLLIGAVLGVILGIAVGRPATGVGAGMLIGMAVGLNIKKK